MSEHILVLGATGPSGVVFSEAALALGHKITIYARTPSKLLASVAKHENVHVVQGGLKDDEKVKEVVSSGPTVHASFLGPVLGQTSGTPITDFYRTLFPLLAAHHYKRIMILCTPSYTAHQDTATWKWWLCIRMIKLISRSAFQEFSGMGEFVESWPVEGENALNWTLFRVPFLLSGEAKCVVASFQGSGLDGLTLNRKSMAQWLLKEIPKMDWVARAPLLSH